MSDAIIINLPLLSGVSNLPSDLVRRDALLTQIEKILEQNDLVCIQGDQGIGKTTLLQDFVYHKPFNVISHFVDKNYNYTYTFDCVLENIYKQIYFYCFGNEFGDDANFDITLLNSIQSNLYRKIRQNNHKNEDLYFVFDGFDNLSNSQLESIIPIFDNLPWGKAKFIFSGSQEDISSLFKNKKNIKTKEFGIMNFGIHETREYLKDLSPSEEQVIEIHKLSNKGLPSTLKEIKLLCIDNDGVDNFFQNINLNDKTDFFQKHWEKVNDDDELQMNILAIIAFNDILLDVTTICNITNTDKSTFSQKISPLPFIELNDEDIKFQTDTLKNFAKNKLKKYEDHVNSLLIEYYENHFENDESKFNLPNLYRKAQQWEKLTKFLELDTFIHLLEKHQSMGNLNTQFATGFEASKKSSQKFNESRLRFALHKSSVKDLEKHELLESEIEAVMEIGHYEQALTLANSAFLKEDRLKLLAILGKFRKIKGLEEDPDLINQIKDLYNQIDFSKIREKGFEISGLLIYCDLQLAINLVEKVTDNSASKNSLDYAFAYLTLYATEINKKNKTLIADIDTINSKIENQEVKNVTNALRFLSDEYNVEELLQSVESLKNFNQKLFLLKSWIINNKKNDEVYSAIKYTLEEIVKASSENVPNATSLSEISIPLPYITNVEHLKDLIMLFDVHRTSLDRPTKDYIRLQLNIAEALKKIGPDEVKDRIFDIYLFISELSDLSVKTDCLCMLWIWLEKNDTGKLIETLLSPNETIETQTKNNIDLLLNDTAFHFKMVEFIIPALVIKNPNFVFDTISKLNTEERRDVGFRKAIINYIQKNKISDIDFMTVDKFYSAINNIVLKEDVIIEVVDRFFYEKEKSIPYIPRLLQYYDLILKITKIFNKCYIITHAIKILNFDSQNYDSKIEQLQKELQNSWEGIDVQWEKIEIGFLISKDLADFSLDESKKYLEAATELKNNEPFSSSSTANTYINSIKLTMRAFCGLLISRTEYSEELTKISDLIDHVESNGEKLKLWSELALRVYATDKKDLFNRVFKEFMNPLLSNWGKNLSDSYKSSTITVIAPSIYFYNPSLFNSDYLSILSGHNKDASIKNICDFLLTKLTIDDPVDDKKKYPKMDYSEVNELCILIENFTNDYSLCGYIEHITKAIKENKSSLTKEQVDLLKVKIRNTINTKLPSSKGISHEGFKIVSEAELLTLEAYNKSQWDDLLRRARLIPNLSDRALVLTMLADKINVVQKSKKVKLDIMDESFNLIKTIPSTYDKSNRFDATWETFIDIDKGKFSQYIKQAYQDLLASKDGEENSLRNLIDVAQQYDTKLAQEFVTMLDTDVARQKLKQPFLNRIESKKRVKEACEQISSISSLNTNQFMEVSRRYIEGLNSGTRTTKEIAETFDSLEKASNMSLLDGFDTYMYFIYNATKRFEANRQNPEILSSIFSATYENTKLIGILSSDNLMKMKNLYNARVGFENKQTKIFSVGEREEAIDFIKNWLRENINDRMYFIDPYFSEKDLEILTWVKEFNPECQVTILTSKEKTKRNDHTNIDNPEISTNKEVYLNAWSKISSEPPIATNIKIVWDKETFSCPFHDRWYVAGEAETCLYLGTSLNGYGNRDSQITSLDDTTEIKEKIEKYIFRKEKKSGKFNLKYEDFDLD